MTEPESLLDRLRRLDKETSREAGAELMVTLVNALPEIIEAFELLGRAKPWVRHAANAGPFSGPEEAKTLNRAIAVLLSKVSQ